MKSIFCFGINHQTAPLEIREKFAIQEENIGKSLEKLQQSGLIKSCVILSTCNRSEFYLLPQKKLSKKTFLENLFHINTEEENCFYEYQGKEAFLHLCHLVSGIDSVIIGETEIFGQVKNAYQISQKKRFSKGLDLFFQKAFSIGKKIRTETAIQKGVSSFGNVAVILAEEIFGNLKETEILLFGTGKMGKIIAKSLKSRGAKSISVMSRQFARAEKLAKEIQAKALPYSEWQNLFPYIDIIISSTPRKIPFLKYETFSEAKKQRKNQALTLIDVAVPRSIDPRLQNFSEVFLRSIDCLREVSKNNKQSRLKELKKAKTLIQETSSLVWKE